MSIFFEIKTPIMTLQLNKKKSLSYSLAPIIRLHLKNDAIVTHGF